jgi:outer membrane protein
VTLSHFFKTAALASVLLAAPAFAQEEPALPDDPNSLTIGVGGAYLPSYEGSDDYILSPAGIVFGKVAGFGFSTRGTSLSLDLIRDAADAPFAVDLGPLVNLRLDRTSRIKDVRVNALGEIDTAIEVGGFVGLRKNGLLHQYDSLGVRLSYQQDVTNTHDSSILSPSIEYATPLSPRTIVTLGASAERVGNGYARTYFSVDAAGALRSGLPVYNARGGWKNVRFSLFAGQVLTGDLRKPGLAIFGGLSYSKLRGDFARSPIVAIAGDADQYLATAGLSYSF